MVVLSGPVTSPLLTCSDDGACRLPTRGRSFSERRRPRGRLCARLATLTHRKHCIKEMPQKISQTRVGGSKASASDGLKLKENNHHAHFDLWFDRFWCDCPVAGRLLGRK